MKLQSTLAALLVAITLTISSLACSPNETTQESSFGISLVETGELIISDKDIASYNASSHEMKLNAEGIARWNLFISSHDPGDRHASNIWCLHQKDFSVKLDGEEIYAGKFWSPLSSMMYEGIVIMYFPELSDEFNTLWISCGYPSPTDDNDSIDNPRIIDFFTDKGLLE